MSKLFDETDNLQKKIKKSIDRINLSILEINNIKTLPLEELNENSKQINNIVETIDTINDKLKLTKKLQRKIDFLNGKFLKFNFLNKKKSMNGKSCDKTYLNFKLKSENNFKQKQLPLPIPIPIPIPVSTNKLDKITNTNCQIDESIKNISHSLDKIKNMSKYIKQKVIEQNNTLNILDNDIECIKIMQLNINENYII